jgi:HAD superfamily hydrolase (TIGR01490 family)
MTDKPAIAVFDLDGTITRNDTYLAYCLGYLRYRPMRAPRAWSLPLSVCAFKAGLRDNTWLKVAFLTAIFGGLPRARVDEWTDLFVRTTIGQAVRRGAAQRIAAHQRAGDRLILASASLDLYVDPLARQLGFSESIATRAAWSEDGRLTGQLAGGNLYGPGKLARLRDLLDAERDGREVIAYTDHHSDLALLRWSDRPVAVNPTRRLLAAAQGDGIAVERWD